MNQEKLGKMQRRMAELWGKITVYGRLFPALKA